MILFLKENNENEVRYIDNTTYKNGVEKKDLMQVFRQDPIKNGEKIRVYHGCTLKTAVIALKHGLSGKERAIRTYSYESGMNPIGIFVTTDFEVAKKFGYDCQAMCVLEFTVNSNDLDTPVWNNSSSYFGQGSNPMPFSTKEERNAQKKQYQKDALNNKYDYITKSDNPAMAERIFDNAEHQALFIGDLNPNMIKRIWVNAKDEESGYILTTRSYIPYKRQDFLKKYGDKEFYIDGTNNEYKKVNHSQRLFLPNEDFTSLEDMAERQYQYDMKYRGEFLKRTIKNRFNGDENAFKENEIAENLNNFKSALNDDYLISHLKYYLWPKQLIQLLGKEKYEEIFDRFGIGTKNESKQIKKIYIPECKLSLLKENASSILYHFTDFDTFKKIAFSNEFKLSKTEEYSEAHNDIDSNTVNNEINGKYPYYISFTRSSNPSLGFSQWYMPNANMSSFGEDDESFKGIVRIEFDGNKLNYNNKVKPIDFFSHKFRTMNTKDKENHENLDKIRFPIDNLSNTSSKEVQLTTPNQNRMIDTTVNPNPFFVQNEDRLFSNEPYLENISQYITRVDIMLYPKHNKKYAQDVFNLAHKTILGQEGKLHQVKDFNGLNQINRNDELRLDGDKENVSTAFDTLK